MAKTIEIKPMNVQRALVAIEGLSPYLQHRWSAKAQGMIREKKAGKKTRDRSATDTEAECTEATYFFEDGGYGIPIPQIKGAIISAASNDMGVPKTLVRKALFIESDGNDRGDGAPLIRMKTPGPKQREDVVRVANGAPDLRYRPIFNEWSAVVRVEFDADLLTLETLVNLIERAGYGVGIGEWRPESKKGGEFGRFRVCRDKVEAVE